MALGTLFSRGKSEADPKPRARRRAARQADFEPAVLTELSADPLEQFVQLGRLGQIAADPRRWRDHPRIHAVYKQVQEAIDEQFGLVPAGFASISLSIQDRPGAPETDEATSPFLLARCCVTNAQYQHFVSGGGYENFDLWPEDIWPHLIDFKDQTDQPGPRYWRDGRHDRRVADHPVVGICFYEAAAFVRWAGFRLPSEAEWQMAASWRIRSSAQTIRRYPWGDALDVRNCNVWAASIGRTLPVHALPQGAAPNGVLQLVGNVWEWTASDFVAQDAEGREIVGDMLLKSIRGGAFDTYFAAQATSTFRTGAVGLARVHNIGFRCAIDLRPATPEPASHPPAARRAADGTVGGAQGGAEGI